MYRDEFQKFVYETNIDGSRKAGSYVAALDMLGPILAKHYPQAVINGSIWHSFKQEELLALHKWLRAETRAAKKGKREVRDDFEVKQKSYLLDYFCSAAVKLYQEFLAVEGIEREIAVTASLEKTGVRAAKSLATIVSQGDELLSSAFSPDRKGRERLRLAVTRLDQSVFRKMVLTNYNGKCCLTGLSIPEVLHASHISAWAEDEKNRLNPKNGLCLSATYDAAFDRHLISFDKDYRLVVSKRIKEFYLNDAAKEYFINREGEKMQLPSKFLPSQKLLHKHLEQLLA